MNHFGFLLIRIYFATASFVWSEAEWGYTGDKGPENWGTLDPAYFLCDTGHEQSPIIIGSCGPINLGGINFKYKPSDFTLTDTGKTLALETMTKNTLNFLKKKYRFKQMHIHAPSEHAIDLKSFPLEIHLVHQSDEGELLKLGIFVESGRSNSTIEKIFAAIKEVKQRPLIKEIDLKALLPTKQEYFYYMGSLATPPCTEKVRWLVMQNPIQMDQTHIKAFTDIYSNNSRPPNPLYRRKQLDVTKQ